MPSIKKTRKGYDYERDGRKVKVSAHPQTYHYKESFDEIEEKIAKEAFIDHMKKTNPDLLNNGKIMFWNPNAYWRNNMGTTDILGVDGSKPPKVSEKPDFGKPWEVREYKGKLYYADETGYFMEKNKYIKLSNLSKKELAQELNMRNSEYSKDEYIRRVYEQRNLFENQPAAREAHKAKQMTKEQLIREITREQGYAPPSDADKDGLVHIYSNRGMTMDNERLNRKIEQKRAEYVKKRSRALREDSPVQKQRLRKEMEEARRDLKYYEYEKKRKKK